MDEPIKKVGDWNVLTTIQVGHKEIALGENPNAEKDQRYLCCYVEQIAVWDTYPEALVSDDFAEIAKIFGERITQAADEILKENEHIKSQIGEDGEIKKDLCNPISENDNLEGQVIVIRGDVLRPEFRHASRQLMLCTGGNGAQPMARGRSCFCTYLYDGAKTSYYRSQVLGVIRPDALPEWAKAGFEKAMAEWKGSKQSEKGKPSVQDRLKGGSSAKADAPKASTARKKEDPSR